MYQVKDAMNDQVVSILPEATIEDAIHLLLDNEVSGAPVIDRSGKLVGIISQFQLLEVMYDPDLKHAAVRDFMTREVVTIEDNALLGCAASLLVVHRIHRLPVTRGGSVVGIISRSDLLRYFVRTGERMESFFEKLKNAQTGPVEPCAVA
jgi:CBS domain-containing protein